MKEYIKVVEVIRKTIIEKKPVIIILCLCMFLCGSVELFLNIQYWYLVLNSLHVHVHSYKLCWFQPSCWWTKRCSWSTLVVCMVATSSLHRSYASFSRCYRFNQRKTSSLSSSHNMISSKLLIQSSHLMVSVYSALEKLELSWTGCRFWL